MKELSEQQWEDIGYRINNRPCTACGYSGTYTEPNYGEIGNINVLTVSCCNCGKVAIYDVAELTAIADAFNEKCIKDGLRTRQV